MAANENNGGNGSTQYIKSDNMSRTDDNRLRNTKREDPMNQSHTNMPGGTEPTSTPESDSATGDEGPSCAI
jgi:hypothetical protein